VVKLADFVGRIKRAKKKTNDFYMVANNHAMERAGMSVLLEDVELDGAYFNREQIMGAVSLWLGPAGTVTPLHHDTTNIVFHQVFGRKRFLLISPFETALLKHARGVYCDLDPERPRKHAELAGVPILEVVLEPGDALFIPVGWWHHVRALDPSISISFTNLRVPNNYTWYVPGSVR
jgi:ribosomal protein L16 Arg81 hydroxylase